MYKNYGTTFIGSHSHEGSRLVCKYLFPPQFIHIHMTQCNSQYYFLLQGISLQLA